MLEAFKAPFFLIAEGSLSFASGLWAMERAEMRKPKDHYFHKAKQQSYPARSVYKLQEMAKRFPILAKGQKVLDLGAAPGSWSQFAAQKVGSQGFVLAVDQGELAEPLPGQAEFVQVDVLEPSPELQEAIERHGPFHLVLSDMAPRTTGIKIRDQARSLELAETALAYAKSCLLDNGSFVAKIFNGPDVPDFTKQVRSSFHKVKTFKPKSSRSESKEVFLVGLGYKRDSQQEDI